MPTTWDRIGRAANRQGRLDPIDQALVSFVAFQEYSAALDSISRRLRSVRTAWSRLDLPEGKETFEALRKQAERLRVPSGCERAQRALMYALENYGAAYEELSWAAKTDNQRELEAAWGHIDDGDVLVSLAVQLTRDS